MGSPKPPGAAEAMQVRGQRVLITGATGGLGPVLVEAFLALGASVIAVGRRRTALSELLARCQQHERLEVAECDLVDAEGVEALFNAITSKEPLDAVVHAAGGFVYAPLHEVSPAEIAAQVRLNVEASALTLRAALRVMRPRGSGRVVLVASDRATSPAPGFGIYGATKAAVVHLVETAALECAHSAVSVNALLPGIIDTPANQAAMPQSDRTGWVKPTDIANAAIWLCGPNATGVSGSLVRLPGA